MRGLGEFALKDVTGRMVYHSWRATGPSITFPEGSCPMKLHAGSWIMMTSVLVGESFSS